MSDHRGTGDVLVSTVVEALYMRYRGLEGFQGVDMGFSHRPGDRARPVLRLHLSSARAGGATLDLPRSFGGIPLELRRVRHRAEMAAPAQASTHHLTGGTACAAEAQDGHRAGQITLMACEREGGQVGFLTSLASVGGVAGRRGSAVTLAGPAGTSAPVAHVTSTCCGRAGLAGFAALEPGLPWLPLERPENLAMTSLRRPAVAEVLRAASQPVTVEGVGIYRIRTLTGEGIDIDGFRTASKVPLPSGALVYDERRWSGVGLATAAAQEDGDTHYAVHCELARVLAALHLRLAAYDGLIEGPEASEEGHPALRPVPKAVKTRRVDAMLGDPRDLAVAGTPEAELQANRRPDIATTVWPPLRRALTACGAEPRGITDRIERLDPVGRARSIIAAATNRSEAFSDLGLRRVGAADFQNCVTFDQVCERIADILGAYAEQNYP